MLRAYSIGSMAGLVLVEYFVLTFILGYFFTDWSKHWCHHCQPIKYEHYWALYCHIVPVGYYCFLCRRRWLLWRTSVPIHETDSWTISMCYCNTVSIGVMSVSHSLDVTPVLVSSLLGWWVCGDSFTSLQQSSKNPPPPTTVPNNNWQSTRPPQSRDWQYHYQKNPIVMVENLPLPSSNGSLFFSLYCRLCLTPPVCFGWQSVGDGGVWGKNGWCAPGSEVVVGGDKTLKLEQSVSVVTRPTNKKKNGAIRGDTEKE